MIPVGEWSGIWASEIITFSAIFSGAMRYTLWKSKLAGWNGWTLNEDMTFLLDEDIPLLSYVGLPVGTVYNR